MRCVKIVIFAELMVCSRALHRVADWNNYNINLRMCGKIPAKLNCNIR